MFPLSMREAGSFVLHFSSDSLLGIFFGRVSGIFLAFFRGRLEILLLAELLIRVS